MRVYSACIICCLYFMDVTTQAQFYNERPEKQIIFPRTSKEEEDKSCSTPSSKEGKCIAFTECRQIWRNSRNLRNSVCGFDGDAPRVCCPLSPDVPKGPTSDNQPQGRRPRTNQTLDESKDTTTSPPTTINTTSHHHIGRNHETSIIPTECGQSSVLFKRIIGGQESTIGAWPWMAVLYLVRRGRKTAECGGALVTVKHVITAAHCVVTSRRGTTLNPRQLLVRLGDYDIESDDDGANPIDVSIKSVIKHRRFNFRNFQNDIAILELSSNVPLSKEISPICLPFDAFVGDDLAERNAFTAGWGTTSFEGPASPKLQEVQLRIWNNKDCERVFRRDVPITRVNICAGDGDKDACRGDSGGPLMLANSDGRFYLIGIVSFGRKCAEPGVPGVYTRISAFLDWIEEKIERKS